MKRALITGIDGFTGAYLADELRGWGYTVTGIGLAPKTADSHADIYLQADMLDAAHLREIIATNRPDAVFHLAGMSHVTRDTAGALYQINIMATRNLLEALSISAYHPEAVVLASTANLYGGTQGLQEETVPPAPQNDYAVSKLAMEYMASLWRRRLPITVVRPFNYTGRRQSEHFLIPKVIRHFADRRPVIEMGNTNISRDFSDVRDVVAAYVRLASSRAPWGPFNICSGRVYTLGEILTMVGEITGHTPEIRVNPAFVRPDDVLCLRGSRRRLEGQVGKLKFRPLEETLCWMLEGAEGKASSCCQ